MIFVSTDYVFDGAKPGPYVESDAVNPVSAYGRSKLAGERATLTASPHSLVVRTSWLFGAGGGNFVETMLRLGEERDELQVVDDQVGCPTFTGHLAQALVELAEGRRTRVSAHRRGGRVLVVRVRAGDIRPRGRRGRVSGRARPTEFPRPARRPANSVLGERARAPRSCPPGRTGSTRTWEGVRA